MAAKAFVLGAFLTGFLGCSKAGSLAEDGKPSGASCTPSDGLTYDSFGRSFMESYCTRCHAKALTGAARNGAPLDHDFDSLTGVLVVAEHIDEYAAAGPDAVNTKMPISAPLPTLDERKRLGKWLACEIATAADGGVPEGK